VDFLPTLHELYGWAAAVLTLLAFSCSNIVRLRYVALAANAAFIAYGFTAELWPVFVLHAILVPVNVWRLRQALRSSPRHMLKSPVGGLASVSVKADTHA
jgi:CRP/FNR family transcriptional regulator, cyclic AMP receptor protein